MAAEYTLQFRWGGEEWNRYWNSGFLQDSVWSVDNIKDAQSRATFLNTRNPGLQVQVLENGKAVNHYAWWEPYGVIDLCNPPDDIADLMKLLAGRKEASEKDDMEALGDYDEYLADWLLGHVDQLLGPYREEMEREEYRIEHDIERSAHWPRSST